jgi:hypothetical protein
MNPNAAAWDAWQNWQSKLDALPNVSPADRAKATRVHMMGTWDAHVTTPRKFANVSQFKKPIRKAVWLS